MKFDKPAGLNPIGRMRVAGQPLDRIDGSLKTTGVVPHAYERRDSVANPAYASSSASPRAGSPPRRTVNPKSARSQAIGAMTMGVGGAPMEKLAADKRLDLFANHDLAGCEVPVHADIPHRNVVFLDEADPTTSPTKAKGVGELGLCGVNAAVTNADHNATGIRVRDCPITLDKLIDQLPQVT